MKTMRDMVMYELQLMASRGLTGQNTDKDFEDMDDEVLFDALCTFKFDEGWRHGNTFKCDSSVNNKKFITEE
jgi:hypothetical protein